MAGPLLMLFFVSSVGGFILDNLDSQVCYGDLGCFSTAPPFRSVERPIDLLPKSPESLQVQFNLYTRQNPTVSQEQKLVINDSSSILSSSFDGNRKTKFIIHGFTHDGHRQWILNMATELLKAEDVNVIAVDWGKGSGVPYTQATANTRVVGALTAKLIQQLVDGGSSLDKFHIIGHSLGAHVSGYAGERLNGLARITGLDPADPYFQGTDVRVRLDPSDAVFVDVIHTDASSLLQLGFGAMQQMGHVDFFPNGGEKQPGCDPDLLSKLSHTVWNAVTQLDYYAAEGAVACSHERSYIYFTESINSGCPFMAYPCTSASEFSKGHCLSCQSGGCSEMGYNADKFPGRGALYLETESTSRYCDYHYQLNVTGKNNMDGKVTIVLQGTKGNSSPVSLMTDNEVHTQGHVISKFFTIKEDIGQVTAVAMQYDKTGNLITGWAYPENWQLLGVSLLSGKDQKLYTFCAYGKSITNHKAVSMGVTGTC